MPRIRSIKPEFWDSPDTIRASLRARLLYIAMWNWADDYGVGDGNLKRLISFAFPGDDISASDFPTLASEVSDCFGVVFYEHAGRPYYAVATWEKHQRTEKRAKQHVPLPHEVSEGAEVRMMPADPRNGAEVGTSDENVGDSAECVGDTGPGTGEQGEVGTGELGNKSVGARKRATRIPEPFIVTREMREWAAVEVPGVVVDTATRMFVDHFRAASGQVATKRDWVAAWRNWLRRDAPGRRSGGPPARESSLDRRDRQVAAMFADLAGQPVLGALTELGT